jgi:TPP-dependent pyruvate/acetoin dehydrogenase alpha subunit
MVHRIIMPDLGQTVAEGKIVRWLKKPGDRIAKGEPLFEVETDKVTMEVEAYKSGYLRELLVGEGEMANAQAPIALLTDEAEESYARPGQGAASPLPPPGALAPFSETVSPEGKTLAPGMYRRMLSCRMFEDRVYYLFLEGRLPGTVHQSQGQEACAVGVCSALEEGDVITSTHRPHSHAVARGLPLQSLMAELFAKKTGCCQAKGGSMHLGDLALGMLPAIAIVGGGIPLATGQALAFQYLQRKNIVACFFGEGATNIGTFHEAVNMAAIWSLPVIYVCENNKSAASTSVEKVMKVKRVSERAAAYGIPGETVDGNDVEQVYEAAKRAAARARQGSGPTLLELETFRLAGHSRSDPGHYRSPDEVTAWKQRDPIARYEKSLLEQGLLSERDVAEIKSAIEHELDEAVRFAEQSPYPLPEDCLSDVFVE